MTGSFARGIIEPTRIGRCIFILLTALLLMGSWLLVFYTGGTQFAFVHLVYLPIVLAGLVFSIPGGLITACIAGVIMGPFMLADAQLDHTQPIASWLFRAVSFVLIGGLSGYGASIFRAYLHAVEQRTFVDAITGLPNLDGLKKIFQTLQQSCASLGVISIDLDHLNTIDHAFGAEETQKLLRHIRDRLQGTLQGDGVSVALIQSKRFSVIVHNAAEITPIVLKLTKVFKDSFYVNEFPVFIEARMGIVTSPGHGDDLSDLIRKTWIAIDFASKNNKQVHHYSNDNTDNAARNIQILHALEGAMENKELTLHYQPKVDLKTGLPVGVEGLMRWTHPTLGVISPIEFVPLAEETLLINPFTKYVLKLAIEQLAIWRDLGLDIQIAVNFSMRNLEDYTVIENLKELMTGHNLKPHQLEIEVTETSVAINIKKVAHILQELRDMGVSIAVDDFGTGQASQQYLFELPVDALKIDKLFIDGITTNPGAVAIVRGSITLGHELNLKVVAEGIESKEQYDLLRTWGCEMGQGYYMAKPMAPDIATRWLQEALSKPAAKNLH